MATLAAERTSLRDSAQKLRISQRHTLRELLDKITESEPPKSSLLPMLRSTANHISRALGQPVEQVETQPLTTDRSTIHAYFQKSTAQTKLISILHELCSYPATKSHCSRVVPHRSRYRSCLGATSFSLTQNWLDVANIVHYKVGHPTQHNASRVWRGRSV